MADLTDAQIAIAEERGRIVRATKPHAVSARYDPASERMIVDLENGSTFAFPPRLVQGLEAATSDELADVELLGDGFALHWERLNVDFTVGGLLDGVFGTAKWMAEKAGRTRSPAKAAAARANGIKGGRPRKAG